MAVKRQQIIAAVLTRLSGIRTSGGYNTNLGSDVHEGKTAPMAAGKKYEVTVQDPTETFTGEDTAHHYWDLRLEIKIKCRDSSLTNETKRKLIADIYKAIGVDDEFGGLTNGVTPVDDESGVVQEGEKLADITVVLTVHYRVRKWQNE